MASHPSSASTGASPAAIRARTLSLTSSGFTPRQSVSRYRSQEGRCWWAERCGGSPSLLQAVVTVGILSADFLRQPSPRPGPSPSDAGARQTVPAGRCSG
eukprot:772718-Alexandrium_andersonii.AAC.1